MRRLVSGIALVVALLALPFLAPNVVRARNPDYDFAAGGGKTAQGDFAISVHCAAGGPAVCTQGGTVPTGHVNKHYPDPSTGKMDEIHGDVTCLVFNAPYAWISWTVNSSKDAAYPVGSTYTFGVADTGGPAKGSPPDLALIDQPSGPNDCTMTSTYSFTNPFMTTAVLSGQVQVHQAAASAGTAMSGNGWYTDSSGNLFIWDSTTNTWTQVL